MWYAIFLRIKLWGRGGGLWGDETALVMCSYRILDLSIIDPTGPPLAQLSPQPQTPIVNVACSCRCFQLSPSHPQTEPGRVQWRYWWCWVSGWFSN